jgi:hypothetical protein
MGNNIKVKVVRKRSPGRGHWGHSGRPGMLGGSKGGPGSGHHGHAGLPGQHGGSAPGWKTSAALSDAWRSNYDTFLKRGTVIDIPALEYFEKVRSGIKANPQRAEEGGGLCALHSINAAKADPTLEVYAGIMLSKQDIKNMEDANPVRYWGAGRIGTIHVWNVDSAGRVIDHAMGSRNAGKIYIGAKVDMSQLRTELEVLSYARNMFKQPRIENSDSLHAQWKRDRDEYVRQHGDFSERL